MSESNPKITNFFETEHTIYLDEFYYVAFADQKFAIEFQGRKSKKEFQNQFDKYLNIINWPENLMKHKALAGLHPEENPNYIKITGRMLQVWAEQGFVPQFDHDFENSRRLVMIPIDAYDYYSEHSKAGL